MLIAGAREEIREIKFEHEPYPYIETPPSSGAMEEKTTPLQISEDLSRKITSLAAGEAHTIALTGKKQNNSTALI